MTSKLLQKKKDPLSSDSVKRASENFDAFAS
jgi:hypothetical protein